MNTYRALVLTKDEAGVHAELQTQDESQLPEGDVTVDIAWSTVNYKDGLAITGKAPVVRSYPMVPGIDFVGTVTASQHADWQAGDRVILNGWGVGEGHPGGFAQKARVNGDWLVALPETMNERDAMIIGTAGYTAMLCVLALEAQGVTPDQGEILVTGASGGVGSIAVMLLAGRGFNVVASTGRLAETDYLKSLGASEVIDRHTLSEPGKPLAKMRWAGAVDTVGSHTLANVLASTQYGGSVAACGLAQGMDLPATVAPFILRSVKLIGVDSVTVPRPQRERAWACLAKELDANKLHSVATEIPLSGVIDCAEKIIAGQVRGRTVVNVQDGCSDEHRAAGTE